MNSSSTTLLWTAIITMLSACTFQPRTVGSVPIPAPKPQPQSQELTGTQWQLVSIQSMDDSNYTPGNPTNYQLAFLPQRQLVIVADCNRGGGIWTQTSVSEIQFTQILSTQAECGPNSLSNRYISQLGYVSSFVFRNDHLFLATVTDGAILEFAPRQENNK